jgi:hypothetical protein
MQQTEQLRRQAFSSWLRTGRWPIVRTADGIECKFNPYHDPTNGRFTFAPGGARGTAYVRPESGHRTSGSGTSASDRIAHLQARPPGGRGSNSGAFQDPMTLEQVAPGLRSAPGGAVVAVMDHLFDFTGPANAMRIEHIDAQADNILADIKRLNPGFHYDELGPNTTVEGRLNRLNDLRMIRAVTLVWVKGDYGALTIETIRRGQEMADKAYEEGVEMLKQGRLKRGTTDSMRLGNYIDTEVRKKIRALYDRYGIKVTSQGRVRVNRVERDSITGSYRQPDIRVDDTAIDISLTKKQGNTPQVRGFFGSDFRPNHVVIITPKEYNSGGSYIVKR